MLLFESEIKAMTKPVASGRGEWAGSCSLHACCLTKQLQHHLQAHATRKPTSLNVYVGELKDLAEQRSDEMRERQLPPR